MSKEVSWDSGSEWFIEHFRWTVFPKDSSNYSSLDQPFVKNWWEQVVGDTDSNISHNTQSGIKSMHFSTTSINGLHLNLSCNPTVFSWEFLPNFGGHIIPQVGKASDKIKAIFDILFSTLNCDLEASRLAIGGVFYFQVESKMAAYATLNELLAPWVRLDVVDSSDFTYRINRRIKSTAFKDLNINNLVEWGAVEARFRPLDNPMSENIPFY